MNNNSKVSPLGICFLSTFLYRTFYIIGFFNLITTISKNDSIFSIIFASILGIIILKSYFYLDNKLKSDNIFNKINKSFPKFISLLFNILLIITFIFIASFVLYNLSIFINYNLLNDIDILPISILLILTCIYVANKGINTITRVSGILIFIFVFIVFISFISLVNYIEPSNIYPLLSSNLKDIYEGSIFSIILSITPIFLLLVIPKEKIEQNNKYHKYMFTTYMINFVYLLICFILVFSILGIKLTNILKYPDIVVLQKISLLNFIERIENILSFKFLFDGFLFLTLVIYYIKEGLINTFKIKCNYNNKIPLLIGISILIINLYLKTTNIKLILYLLTIVLIIHSLLMLFIRKEE